MTAIEAQRIVESLANGNCPVTGQSLGPAFQQPDIIRALFLAARALGRMKRFERKQEASARQAGNPWTVDEDRRLCNAFDAGTTIPEISLVHQRTINAIEARLERFGKISPEDRSISFPRPKR